MSRLVSDSFQFLLIIVSRTRLLTVGDRAFPVAAARVWNSLPDLVTSAPSVAVFRSRLKTHLFNISYPCDCTVPAHCTVTLVALDIMIVLAYLLTCLWGTIYRYSFSNYIMHHQIKCLYVLLLLCFSGCYAMMVSHIQAWLQLASQWRDEKSSLYSLLSQLSQLTEFLENLNKELSNTVNMIFVQLVTSAVTVC